MTILKNKLHKIYVCMMYICTYLFISVFDGVIYTSNSHVGGVGLMRSWNAMQNKYMTYMLNTSTSIFYLRTPAILNRHRENAPVSTNFGLADFDNMSRMLLISLESNLPFPSFILPRYIGTKSSKGRRHVERSVLGTNEDDQYTPLCSLAVVRIPTFHVQFVCCIASIQRPTYNDRSRVGD